MIAAALNVPLHRTASGEHGATCGAVRLARMAVTEEAPEEVCTPPAPEETILPDPVLAEAYAARIALYRALTIKVLRDGELWRAA